MINAIVLGLAAFPAFFLAKRFVSKSWASLVAVFSVLVPSMLYSGTLLTEVVLYPAFLLALLGIVAALQHPSRRNQLLAVGGIGLACTAKSVGGRPRPGVRPLRDPPGHPRQTCRWIDWDARRAHSTATARSRSCGLLPPIVGLGIARGSGCRPRRIRGGSREHRPVLVAGVARRHLAALDLYVAVIPFAASLP